MSNITCSGLELLCQLNCTCVKFQWKELPFLSDYAQACQTESSVITEAVFRVTVSVSVLWLPAEE